MFNISKTKAMIVASARYLDNIRYFENYVAQIAIPSVKTKK